MRVDSHVHIWRSVSAPAVATIVSGHCDVPAELLAEYLDQHGVDRAVLVQPVFPDDDNSYIADIAAREPTRYAAVCVVDPRKSDAADRLQYWTRERGCRGLRLRPRVPGEGDVFGAASTWPLWQAAEEQGVVISVLASTEHLPTIGELASRFPTVPIVVDHLGHPELRTGVPAASAAAQLLDLVEFTNVHVKVSGYYYFSRRPYPYEDCRDLVRAVYDAFGPARLLWGSDFPHVLLKSGYGRMLAHTQRNFDWMTADELRLVMGHNALALYWPSEVPR